MENYLMRIRVLAFAVAIAAVSVAAIAARADEKVSDQPGDKFIYLKKATREETRSASLAAMGVSMHGAGPWYLIGPFDNKGLETPYPPEKQIDLDARYPGKGQEAVWQKMDFADGKINDLRHFKQSDHCICYLYRRIDMATARNIDVSLGSDNGLIVWLNGKKLLTDDATRPAAPDEDHLVLPLKAGRNDLLLKVSNVTGDWAFYFAASIPQKFDAKLNRQLNRDFPQGGEADSYEIDTLPTPTGEAIEVGGLKFRPDGKLFVATRRGDVWLVSNPTDEDPDKITWKPYVRGLHEILGLCVVGKNDLYLVQRPELTLVRSTKENDIADDFTTDLRQVRPVGRLSRIYLRPGPRQRRQHVHHAECRLRLRPSVESALSRLLRENYAQGRK